jgi:hypothetical protein
MLMMTFGFTLAVCLIGPRIPNWIDSGDRPGHRGFGHSLFSLILFTIVALLVSSQLADQGLAVLYAVSLAAGYLSHLLLDFVTYEGVPWFWPLDEKYSLDLDSAGGSFRRLTRIPGFDPVDLSARRPLHGGHRLSPSDRVARWPPVWRQPKASRINALPLPPEGL